MSKFRAYVGAVTCLTIEGSGRLKWMNFVNVGSFGKGVRDMEMKLLFLVFIDCLFVCWNFFIARL